MNKKVLSKPVFKHVFSSWTVLIEENHLTSSKFSLNQEGGNTYSKVYVFWHL